MIPLPRRELRFQPGNGRAAGRGYPTILGSQALFTGWMKGWI